MAGLNGSAVRVTWTPPGVTKSAGWTSCGSTLVACFLWVWRRHQANA